MQRYFFHTHNGSIVIDHEGAELPGPDEARSQAIDAVSEMLKVRAADFWKDEDWTMQVKDALGRTVCTIMLSGARGEP